MKGLNLSRWAVNHPAIILFLIMLVSVAGTLAYFNLGRQEDPSFTIKVAVVSVVWPGASAEEMQNQVTDQIEKKMQELPYFNKVTTYNKPNFAAMMVEFRDNTPPREVPQLFYQIRKKLDDIRADLPQEVILHVNDEFGDVDSVLYTLSSQDADYFTLKHLSDTIKSELLRVPNVAKVNIYGILDPEIYVEFSQVKLANLGISAQQIFDSLARQNAVMPAGVVQTLGQRVPVRVTGAIHSAEQLAQTSVEAGGKIFALGDIANVYAGTVDPPSFFIHSQGIKSLAIGVTMQKGANIIELGKNLNEAIVKISAELPLGVDLNKIADQPKVVDHAVFEFMRSFLEALVIVLVVSFISLGWRTGIVVALSVPLVLAIVFVIMVVLGIDLHRITLGALIIALGLLVDDAIIAAEMMVVKREEGFSAKEAAAFAWQSTAFPMLTGTLVTAIGFVPIGFANSAVGEYAGGIFWVVAIALLTSWVVAVVFTPYLGVKLLPKTIATHHDSHHDPYHGRFYGILRRAIRFSVDHALGVSLVTLAVFILAIFAFKNVQQQFFPLSERPELFLEMRLPEGTSIEVTDKVTIEAEALLKDDDNIDSYTSYIGQSSPRFWLGLNQILPNEAFAQIVIVAKDTEARERVKTRLDQAVAQGALGQARVRIDRFNFGPPVGFPVQFRVLGPEPKIVRQFAYLVRDTMASNRDVVDPNLDWNERMPDVRVELQQDRIRTLGLNSLTVAQSLQMLLSGVTVTTLRNGIDTIGVIARAPSNERLQLDQLNDLVLMSVNGTPISVGQVARVSYGSEEPILWRRNRDTVITVRTDVVDGVQPPDVTAALLPMINKINAQMPVGYRIETGGAVEESQKANDSINKLFPVMILAMLTVLMFQLQSFSRLALVFLTAPLGLIGASLALNLAHRPFGFVALLGLIALAGMIMRNSVILVDQIESDVASGRHNRHDAIVESTVRRARPVLLTALAAILAMIPLQESAFWGPMAITIMGGLFVATVLTLISLPAFYALWFRRSLEERRDERPQHATDPEFSPAALAE